MEQSPPMQSNADTTPGEGLVGEEVWSDVLQAMDRTYAELVDYQEELEARNAELTSLRNFLGSIMTSISDYLVVTDRSGRIAEASASFCAAQGKAVEAMTGVMISEVFDAEEGARVRDAIARTLAAREVREVSAQMVTAAGREPVEFRISPRLDRRGKATGAILAGRPMGELLRAYDELETSHRELKDTQGQLVRNEKMASLGRLLAGVAHELNNPISFVYANTYTLDKYLNRFETYFERVQAGASREELIALRAELKLDRNLANLRGAVTGARDGAERVRDIVEDLRRLSADGSGESTCFDLVEVARLSASWIERGMKSEVALTFEGAPRCMVTGRRGHIQQVLMNLVQNAVDAMAGSAAPEIRFETRQEGDRVVMDVCDAGPGVPEDMRATIFDPFFTTKEVGKGTGLGLSISHKIVEEHGGALELVEGGGPGACFRLTLPGGEAA
ncbi:PAS domain-containing sensor histidine kinase [Vannielia litorea]|uniref:PAS domain-containing sensor histidine kinase n=1 Tax=Vannielia litorea TaxID=1217970 RepID=UPI001FD242F4|nr:ATP-binding protein [Vannielia litorea]